MGISLVTGQIASATSTWADHLTVSLPSAATAGNAIIVGCYTSGDSTSIAGSVVDDKAGGSNTYNGYAEKNHTLYGNVNTRIFCSLNVGAATQITFTAASGGTIACIVSEWAGIAISDAVDDSDAGDQDWGTAIATPALTCGGADLVVTVCGTNYNCGAGKSWTHTNYTDLAELALRDGEAYGASHYRILTGAGSETPSFSLSAAAVMAMSAVAFKPAAAAAGIPRRNPFSRPFSGSLGGNL